MKPIQTYSCLIGIILISAGKFAAPTITITKSNFADKKWMTEQIMQNPTSGATEVTPGTSYIAIECPPVSSPSTQKGSLLFTFPRSQEPNLRRTRARNGLYHDVSLRSLSIKQNRGAVISYSTFVVRNQNYSNINLVLQIDNDNNGSRDLELAFTPTKQFEMNGQLTGMHTFEPVRNNVWQTWPCNKGWWLVYQTEEGFNLDPAFANRVLFRLEDYIAKYPNARIVNTGPPTPQRRHEGYGVRFTIGGDGTDHNEFVGYVDLISIRPAGSQAPAVHDFKGQACSQ